MCEGSGGELDEERQQAVRTPKDVVVKIGAVVSFHSG